MKQQAFGMGRSDRQWLKYWVFLFLLLSPGFTEQGFFKG